MQEWIAKEPNALGEELLIIQKEFSGFDDTNERLDLLALDKQGTLVIIENKLDDSGRDVTWQALKYASYCSSLSKENIRKIYQDYLDITSPNTKAEERISEFLEGQDFEDVTLNKGVTQRIILIAAKFRKEVTSTVLWLLNFKVRLQCFRATPYSMGDELFLTIEQIIPTQDAEEYMIGMAEKALDDIKTQTELKQRQLVMREFWTQLLQTMNSKSSLFKSINPGLYHWIGVKIVRGIGFNFAATKAYGRAALYIDRGDKEENERIFDELINSKEEIEQEFRGKLIWERMDGMRACRIKSEINGDVFDREQRDKLVKFMTDNMVRLHNALRKPIENLGAKLDL